MTDSQQTLPTYLKGGYDPYKMLEQIAKSDDPAERMRLAHKLGVAAMNHGYYRMRRDVLELLGLRVRGCGTVQAPGNATDCQRRG